MCEAFMKGYEDSPTTTFVGQTVQYGYATILDRYKKALRDPGGDGQVNLFPSRHPHPGLQLRQSPPEIFIWSEPQPAAAMPTASSPCS